MPSLAAGSVGGWPLISVGCAAARASSSVTPSSSSTRTARWSPLRRMPSRRCSLPTRSEPIARASWRPRRTAIRAGAVTRTVRIGAGAALGAGAAPRWRFCAACLVMFSAPAIELHDAPATRAHETASRSRRSSSPRRTVMARNASSGSSVLTARRRSSARLRSPDVTHGVYPPTVPSTPVAPTLSGATPRETPGHAKGHPPQHPHPVRRGGSRDGRQRGDRREHRRLRRRVRPEHLGDPGRVRPRGGRGPGAPGREDGTVSRGGAMTNQPDQYRPLTREELSELAGEELPERAAMSLVNANVAIPINAAIAANVLSDGATAAALATQQTPIDQSNL